MKIQPSVAQQPLFSRKTALKKFVSPRFGKTEKSILREVGEAGVDFVKGFAQEFKAAPLKEKLSILPVILGCVIIMPLTLLIKFPILVKDMAQVAAANRRHRKTPPSS